MSRHDLGGDLAQLLIALDIEMIARECQAALRDGLQAPRPLKPRRVHRALLSACSPAWSRRSVMLSPCARSICSRTASGAVAPLTRRAAADRAKSNMSRVSSPNAGLAARKTSNGSFD